MLFSPALVQGEGAPASIVAAIERVERDGRASVLLLSRGGGAVEELACFNDERVVRAVANCSIPVITGIGHQRDQSLADLVADACAHTPTAAAEQVVPELAEIYAQHRQRITALNEAVNQQLVSARRRQQLVQGTTQRLQMADQHCQMLRQKLATLDPRAVLKRGYAVVRQENGAIARSSTDLALDQELAIQLGQGQVKVRIIEILTSKSLDTEE